MDFVGEEMIGDFTEKSIHLDQFQVTEQTADAQPGGVTNGQVPPAPASIRERRRALRMNQAELAAEAGIRCGTVALIENGSVWLHGGRDYQRLDQILARFEQERAAQEARLDFSSFNSDPGDGGQLSASRPPTYVATQSTMGGL